MAALCSRCTGGAGCSQLYPPLFTAARAIKIRWNSFHAVQPRLQPRQCSVLLCKLLVRLGHEYPTLPPLYVTENGSAWDDVVEPDGSIDDEPRVEYLLAHLDAVAGAIDEGADVRGYFVWSLLDNFEWAWGYDKRFGIVHVDYETQKRTIKRSGRVYAQLISEARAATTATAAP